MLWVASKAETKVGKGVMMAALLADYWVASMAAWKEEKRAGLSVCPTAGLRVEQRGVWMGVTMVVRMVERKVERNAAK